MSAGVAAFIAVSIYPAILVVAAVVLCLTTKPEKR